MSRKEREIALVLVAALALFFVPRFRPMITNAALSKARELGLWPQSE